MAKKFVRGITDIKTITNQDFDTNNVNDLLSDGKHNYIHRKKQDGSEEYHNLTNNIKTIEAEDNGLLTVINYNNSTNKAKLTVNHDPQKEQVLESTDETILISHGENGTEETTSVDVNPEKVLQHDNLQTSYGISKTTTGTQTTLGIGYTQVAFNYDLNNLTNGRVKASGFTNAPKNSTWFLVSSFSEGDFTVQEAIELIDPKNTVYKRTKQDGVWGVWREQVGDKSAIDTLLDQKQNKLVSNASIGLAGTSLRQLYALKQTYSNADGVLKTHVTSVSPSNNINLAEEDFYFLLKINKGATSATFTLNEHNKTKFESILSSYGQNGSVNIIGCVFTLSGSDLTVSTSNNVDDNYVITFSDVI